MTSARAIGRVVGALLLVHLAGGLVLPYVLLGPALAPPGFLASAAPHAVQVRAAVVLFLAGAALAIGIAITAWPVFRQHGHGLALAFLALAVANFPLQASESGTLLSMLSLSQAYGQAGSGEAATAQAVAAAVGTARRFAHYIQLVTIVGWLFVLYTLLWRTALVPRLLAVLGAIATLVQLTGVPIRAILGYSIVPEMAMPLAPVHAALALWLMVKGFPERVVAVSSAAAGTDRGGPGIAGQPG